MPFFKPNDTHIPMNRLKSDIDLGLNYNCTRKVTSRKLLHLIRFGPTPVKWGYHYI